MMTMNDDAFNYGFMHARVHLCVCVCVSPFECSEHCYIFSLAEQQINNTDFTQSITNFSNGAHYTDLLSSHRVANAPPSTGPICIHWIAPSLSEYMQQNWITPSKYLDLPSPPPSSFLDPGSFVHSFRVSARLRISFLHTFTASLQCPTQICVLSIACRVCRKCCQMHKLPCVRQRCYRPAATARAIERDTPNRIFARPKHQHTLPSNYNIIMNAYNSILITRNGWKCPASK